MPVHIAVCAGIATGCGVVAGGCTLVGLFFAPAAIADAGGTLGLGGAAAW